MKIEGLGSLSVLFLISIILTGSQSLNFASAIPGDSSGTLYGTDPTGGPSGEPQVVTINTGTGLQTPLPSPTGLFAGPPGLAFDTTNGILYMTEGGGSNTIYTVNLATGVETTVGGAGNFGNLGLGFATVSSLDFNAAGILYGSANLAGDGGTGADHLVTINLGSGLATIIGPFGVCSGFSPGAPFPLGADGSGSCSIDGMEAIGFDATGQLWGIVRGSTVPGTPNTLYKINHLTGASTSFGPINNAPAGGIVSMQFACDGTIYVGTNTADGGRLGQITLGANSGTYSAIGGGTQNGQSLAGLAFDTACRASPQVIGGELLPIDTTALLVAGAQSSVFSILGALAGAVAIGALYYSTRRKVSV